MYRRTAIFLACSSIVVVGAEEVVGAKEVVVSSTAVVTAAAVVPADETVCSGIADDDGSEVVAEPLSAVEEHDTAIDNAVSVTASDAIRMPPTIGATSVRPDGS